VVNISWHDAVSYCKWLGSVTSKPVWLPTEAEWEKAARGGASGQRFSWGNTIDWNHANYYGDPLSLDQSGCAYDNATAINYDPAFNAAIPQTG